MNKRIFNNRIASFLLLGTLALTIFSCNDDNDSSNTKPMAPDVNFTVLTNTNSIVKYNAKDLSKPISTVAITGLPTSEKIVSIDYRPATGQLYALGTSSRLYFINEESGLATALGSAAFTPALSDANASIDFNPTVDRVRLVTSTGQNLRLHPELGTVAAPDGSINGGTNPTIGAVAYTNSVAGASSTQLFDIDFTQDKLYIQNPPNNGTLEEVGSLTVDFAGVGDFDISPDNKAALAVTFSNNESKLYTINLTTGKAENIGVFGLPVIGIAFKTNPVAFAASTDNKLYRFDPTNPTMNSVAFMGLASGEVIVGLDFRPATGTLYAISNQSRLLTVNTSSGQVTAINTLAGLSGTSFGFDFNPTVDRIRLVSNTGQNLRLHPDLGTIVGTDGILNPNTPAVSAAAYTNNFIATTTTNLFVIDHTTNMLYNQTPPNNGVLVPVGDLGIDVEAENGFDIGGSSNKAFGLFKVGGTTAVYSVNLTTGAATKVKDFNISATAMAVGLGF
ncbi:DUF4394 domain-containing protein [Flavobacterium seoulense]|uniref:DUF4394 domain-containing protein n=1 Tax=Flavobacterium seoulense TaxID=1492738 RepID=A0A066WMI9_9FLAO|nr:DUF4394 domain-containing protein [Flavobacterium seoulense]KDN55242.1 hypothetical protein FEM21_18330 [Flavobacterium seoulense]